MAQSSWLKPSFVTLKQGNLKSQLVNILESFTSFCASGMVPLASWGSGKGLLVFKVVLVYDDSQRRGGCRGGLLAFAVCNDCGLRGLLGAVPSAVFRKEASV